MTDVNTGRNLESYVHYVYSRLLEITGIRDVIVSERVTIKGKSEANNEFDIYYEFQHLNTTVRVVIECKDWKSPVTIKEIRDFAAKIEDVGMGNMIGIVISKAGYQDGAKKFASSSGIQLLNIDDLPTLPEIVAGILQKTCLPNEEAIGEPFWLLMKLDSNGLNTGDYWGPTNSSIGMFFSKPIAKLLKDSLKLESHAVRGCTQQQLKFLTGLAENQDVSFYLYPLPLPEVPDFSNFPMLKVAAEQLENDYLI